jgi:hypothetical protein
MPADPSPFFHSWSARNIFPRVLLAGLAAGFLASPPAHGQDSITVPNYSFENPTTTFVSTVIDDWQKAPQSPDFNPNQGYTWDQITGIFFNGPGSAYITNADGQQVGYIFADPGAGLFQQLSATYQPGKAYRLTVGIVGQGGGILDGVTLDLQLYYLLPDGATMSVIADTTVTENSTNFPNHTTEYDFTASLPMVEETDLWAGQPIGIQILSTATSADEGGYWDVDNVQLMATPEPGAAALLACGGLALLRRRARRAA